jgi:hypothetical protein
MLAAQRDHSHPMSDCGPKPDTALVEHKIAALSPKPDICALMSTPPSVKAPGLSSLAGNRHAAELCPWLALRPPHYAVRTVSLSRYAWFIG